ncbi:MAG: translation initiation factor eIF-1A [Candidatus Odinarchaeota archaeon]
MPKKEKGKKGSGDSSIQEVQRVRVPEEGELLGEVVQLLGHETLRVRCADGKIRLCRIPGRMIKKTWIKEGDIVLIVPWDFQYETRGDIIWRYTQGQVQWLEKKGYMNF